MERKLTVTLMLLLQFAVVLAAIYLGSRAGGVGLGLWGAVGVLVLTVVFGLPPTSPPIDVMLIILAVIMASAVMETAGGIKFLVNVAERIIRRYPKQITVVAPLVSYCFTFGAGTGHVFYPLLPVIYEVAHQNKIRPERPIAISTIASQQAITASPVSAAMAAMIALFATSGIGLIQIMLIAVPATLTGVIVAALVQMRIGKELEKDPEYLRRLEAGEIQPPKGFSIEKEQSELPRKARLSALLFLAGVAVVVLAGAFPQLRPLVPGADGPVPLGMPLTIQIVMLSVGALILLLTKAPVADVPRSSTAQAGLTAVIGIFGLAWLGDTFIKANEQVVISGMGTMAQNYPATFAIGLFFASVLLFSQAATTRALMPLGLSLGIPAASLIGMWPAVNGYFFLPTYGSLIAAINFDRSGTTRIGRFILNHSFMIPGLISTITAVTVGLIIGNLFF
jgi:anaerobic C4-dicarboxylate transporter DcuA